MYFKFQIQSPKFLCSISNYSWRRGLAWSIPKMRLFVTLNCISQHQKNTKDAKRIPRSAALVSYIIEKYSTSWKYTRYKILFSVHEGYPVQAFMQFDANLENHESLESIFRNALDALFVFCCTRCLPSFSEYLFTVITKLREIYISQQ